MYYLKQSEILYEGASTQELAVGLIRSSEKEILVVFSTSNAFLRQVKTGGAEIILEAASRNVVTTILTPMNENARIVAQQLENQNKNIRVQEIEPSSHITITALI